MRGEIHYTSVALNVSVLFNEPKLLKYYFVATFEIADPTVSVLFNEPKLLKYGILLYATRDHLRVSVLFNEPKLLKSISFSIHSVPASAFQCSSTSRNC